MRSGKKIWIPWDVILELTFWDLERMGNKINFYLSTLAFEGKLKCRAVRPPQRLRDTK